MLSFRRCIFALCGLLFGAGLCAAPARPHIETGEIAGARYAVAIPAKWNHTLLLVAHDYRPESAPLQADLRLDDPVYGPLIQDGWMVASTSFRRNGIVVRDAIEDLDALRDVLIEAHGRPSQALLVGEGLGGTIVTIMAERLRERYTGALALVPAFDMSEPNSMTGITHSPHIPLLLVATRTSYQPILQYTQRVPVALDDQLVRPQIARVDRTGRTNINDAERLVALRLLHAWMDQGREAYASPENRSLAGYSTPWRAIEKSPDLDITCTPRPGPSTVVWADNRRSFTACVLEVAPYSGHVTLDIRPEDFNQLGLGRKSYVEMRAGERTIRVAMGRDFDSVKRGEWVAFPDANGTICLARHGGNAAVSASLRTGDSVTFRRYDPPPKAVLRP
ncbi:MAG TPA: hypothetical protein PLV33_07055 [Opitutaceae bacterium]|nr:hypothetical protein [Opitutaceae bacterium]HPK49971.1 hypothetical protein [Opitutaceae bacterium]